MTTYAKQHMLCTALKMQIVLRLNHVLFNRDFCLNVCGQQHSCNPIYVPAIDQQKQLQLLFRYKVHRALVKVDNAPLRELTPELAISQVALMIIITKAHNPGGARAPVVMDSGQATGLKFHPHMCATTELAQDHL